MRCYARDGTWTWSRWLLSLLRFPVNAYFTWDDPAPGLYVGRRLFRAAMGRIAGANR